VGVGVDVAKPAVELEPDPAFRDREDESAIGAFVIFPAAMGLFEKLVTEMLDGLLKRMLGGVQRLAVLGGRLVGHLDCGEVGIRVLLSRSDAGDPAAIAFAVKLHRHASDVGGCQSIEDDCFVDGGCLAQIGLAPGKYKIEVFGHDTLLAEMMRWMVLIDSGTLNRFCGDLDRDLRLRLGGVMPARPLELVVEHELSPIAEMYEIAEQVGNRIAVIGVGRALEASNRRANRSCARDPVASDGVS
jgi:hypothetical protein